VVHSALAGQSQRRSLRHCQGGHEFASPDTGTLPLGFGFRRQIVGRVLAVVECPSLADEAVVDAFAAGVALGQQPAVAITGVADALDLPSAQVLCQPLRSHPAAWPLLSKGGARLIRLGRIDALRTHMFARDDDGVAVDSPSVPATSACAKGAFANTRTARVAGILI
jgi:hypothetical protein